MLRQVCPFWVRIGEPTLESCYFVDNGLAHGFDSNLAFANLDFAVHQNVFGNRTKIWNDCHVRRQDVRAVQQVLHDGPVQDLAAEAVFEHVLATWSKLLLVMLDRMFHRANDVVLNSGPPGGLAVNYVSGR